MDDTRVPACIWQHRYRPAIEGIQTENARDQLLYQPLRYLQLTTHILDIGSLRL